MNIYRSLSVTSRVSQLIQRPAARLPLLAAARYASSKASAESKAKAKPRKSLADMDLLEFVQVARVIDPELKIKALKKKLAFARKSYYPQNIHMQEYFKKHDLKTFTDGIAATREFKTLDDAAKQHYYKLAQDLSTERDIKLKEWFSNVPIDLIKEIFRLKLLPKTLKTLIPGLKVPPNSFARFFIDFRNRYISEHGTTGKEHKNTEIMKLATREWAAMPHPDQEAYRQAALRDKVAFNTLREEHNAVALKSE
ncbi:hypothetical protein BDQ17DRAFT_1367466, partial [Cyathus striatus]